MSFEGDKSIMDRIPKANKATALMIGGVDPDNYDRIKLEEKGLDYFRELVAPYDLWAEVKTSLDIKAIGKVLKLKEINLKEVWKDEIKESAQNQKDLQNQYDNQKNKELTGDRAKYLLSQEKPVFKSLGLGIHNNCLYFGTKVYDGNNGMDAIVTSDKKILISYPDNNQIKQFGINYRYPFIDSVLDYQWSNNSTDFSIMEFVYGNEKKVEIKECYEDTIKNFKAFMDYEQEEIYISKACDLISSFYLEVFEAKGRSFDNAEKGSGKTRDAILYDLQMFNPIMSADMSGPSYFRIIESTSASIIIDDFDAIEDDKKQSQVQIMRTGYKKGQKAVRVGDDKMRTPAAFSVYNSMKINNVGGLDDITQDRCNTYYLIKSTNKKKTDKKLNDKDPKWLVQRDKKYYCALQNWELVKETYDNLEIEGLSGRNLEKVAPILTIGKIALNEEKFQKLVDFELGRIKDQKTKDVSDDWLFQSLRVIVSRLGSSSVIELQLDELVKSIMDLSEDDSGYKRKKHGISVFLGKCFRNTPLFKSGKVHGGYVKYTFKPEGVLKFLEIRDYIDFFSDMEIDTLKQSIQPNQSNQSNQPHQPIQDIKVEENGEDGEDGEVGELPRGGVDTETFNPEEAQE